MIKRILSMLLLLGLILSSLPVSAAERGVSLTTDEAFFGKLQLSAKGLEQVKAAVEKSDYTTAKKELLQYYKNKFTELEAKPFDTASDSAVFMAMHDVWAFSENYITGAEITATSHTPYTLDLGNNLGGIYILDQIYATVDGVAIGTSESNNPPELSLYDSKGNLLKTIYATEDTTVRPGKGLSTGYGDMKVMYAKHWPDTAKGLPYSSSTMRAYVRFDATQIPSNARSGKLTVYAKRSPGNADKVLVEDSLYLSVFRCYSTNWSESSLTWDTLIEGNGIGHYSYNGLPGGFDWKKPAGTPSEWLNYNTRFYETRSLVLRGTEAGTQALRDSYMQKAKELVLDFITDGGENTPAKRALEPANRLIEFPFIYKHLVTGDYITPDENVKMLSWLYDDATAQYQGAYTLFDGATATPKSNLPYTNWGLWHLTGFYSALSYFPEFADASAWKTVYDARLSVTMNGIIKEDGSYNEVTFGYPASVISWCATLKDIMNQFGDTSGNAAMFSKKMLQLTKYLVDCSMPNGKNPFWGEGGSGAVLEPVNTTLAGLSPQELQEELSLNLQYFADKSMGLPSDTMAQYDGIKVVTDRTGWTSSDSMIFMNAKCAGSHSHRDALALLLYYEGRSLLTDTGMTSYDGAHPHFAFQRSSSRSHNTIEIDGIAQTLGTMVDDGAAWGSISITGNDAMSAITSNSLASNKSKSSLKVEGTQTTTATHSTDFDHIRDVSFLKELGSILIVTDQVVPGDSAVHSYTQNWHCAPYSNGTIAEDGYLTGKTAYAFGANLLIAQAKGSDPITPTLQTGYDATSPATPTKYFEYKQSKSGVVTYQTLLYPVTDGATATVAPEKLTMADTTDKQALAMEIAITDSSKPELATLTHYHSFEDQPTVRSFGTYTTNGLTAVTAQDREGKLFYASIVGGDSLTEGGKAVLKTSHALEDVTAVEDAGTLALYSGDPQAQTATYEIRLSGAEVKKVTLNGKEIAFTQDSDGTVYVKSSYVLLDFNKGDIADSAENWDSFRVTDQVDHLKGTLSGEISGGDPNLRMNATCEDLAYEIKAGDIIELRMKTTVTEGIKTGAQVFFLAGSNTSYSEKYSVKDFTLEHATGRYATIELPFLSGEEYIGKVLHSLRIDMLHTQSQETVVGEYEIDYIYIGPKESAPSRRAEVAQYLYFDFTNKTADRERYGQEAYGGYPYDLECWGYNYNRTEAPVIDNGEGTLSFRMKAGTTSGYVQTSDFTKSLTARPLYYIPHESDRVQVRLRFEHCVPTTDNPLVALYCIRDEMENMTDDHRSGYMTREQVLSGEYVVVEFPVSDLFGSADCINALRFTIGNVEDDGSGLSRVVIDYFYVGPEEILPVGDRLYFGFDNTEADRERYSRKTYGGYLFDTGYWGVNLSRAETPVMRDGAMILGIANGSTGPYVQTTTGGNTLATMPLIYIPGENDLVQLRVKFRNCTATKPYLSLFYIKDNSATVTNDHSKVTFDPAYLTNDTYFVATFPVPAGFTEAEVINAIRLNFAGIADDGTGEGEIIVDYAYIGPREGLPTPMYDVTFLNEDGTVLHTVSVLRGEAATYGGTAPTKAWDEKNHYNFEGWDKPLTDITEDTTVTATYTSVAHGYTYSETDDACHTAACSCGYSKSEEHTVVTDSGTSATCTADGLTEGKHCSVCDAVLVAQTVVTAKGHTEVVDEAVAPTCTETGLTEGKHCSVCSQVLLAQETVPETGHAPVYTPKNADFHTVTCESCNHGEEAPHTYADGKCICGQIEVKEPVEVSTWKLGHSLNLASDISVNYAIAKASLTDFDTDTIYILAELDIYEGNTKTGAKTVKLLPTEQGDYYYFTLNGLTAVNMNDEIRAVLYGTKDGQVHYSPVDDYSIATYAYAQMNKATNPQKLKSLCAELLRYGGKAQSFKSYRLDALADVNMTEAHRAYLSDMDGVTFGNTNKTLSDLDNAPIKWQGKALDLASKVTIKFIFSMGSYTGDISDLTLRVSYEDIHGNPKTMILNNGELYNSTYQFYAFTLDSLLAAELRCVLSVQVYAGDIPVSCTVEYAADTYGNNKTGALGELCKALFAYCDSAKDYFAS